MGKKIKAYFKTAKKEKMRLKPIFGWDPREDTAWDVCRDSKLTLTDPGEAGYIVFVNCDLLFVRGNRDVLEQTDPSKAVLMVQQDHRLMESPKVGVCMQHPHPRKNRSFYSELNCDHCFIQKLSAKAVKECECARLRVLQWLNDSEIGNLGIGLNDLEGRSTSAYEKLKTVH